jgi:3'-phosphoadenosine 5'-phosphosulfate (PAPS) 3'-phosphatase
VGHGSRALLVEEAGGRVTDMRGNPSTWSLARSSRPTAIALPHAADDRESGALR